MANPASTDKAAQNPRKPMKISFDLERFLVMWPITLGSLPMSEKVKSIPKEKTFLKSVISLKMSKLYCVF